MGVGGPRAFEKYALHVTAKGTPARQTPEIFSQASTHIQTATSTGLAAAFRVVRRCLRVTKMPVTLLVVPATAEASHP